MKPFRLFMLLLVPMLSVQASAQVETDTVVVESSMGTSPETVPPEEADDNTLQVQVKGFLDTYHAVRAEGKADLMASRTRARGEVKLEKGAASLLDRKSVV